MTPAARISAAIEVLADIETRRRPAADALKDWGLAHRFAGSGDRAAIAGLLYDALRRKASSAFMMGESTPRAALLGMLRLERKLDLDAIAQPGRRQPLCAVAAHRRGARAARCREPRRRAAVGRGRLSGMARSAASPRPSATSAPRKARRWPRARRSICASTRSRRRARKRSPSLPIFRPTPTRWSPLGLRIVLGRRCPQSGDPCRAGLHQGPDRNPGRRLAARRAARRRQARPAGDRSLRRRRRQDARARGRDGEQGPALRHRRRQAAPCADPRTARTRRRAQCAGPHAARRSPTCSPISPARPISC